MSSLKPRLVDIFVSHKPKAPARATPSSTVAQDGSHLVIGEPLPLDMSAVRRSRRRRVLITQDGTAIARDEAMPASCIGEAMPIWGESLAMDERPAADLRAITFDGATPSSTRKETR